MSLLESEAFGLGNFAMLWNLQWMTTRPVESQKCVIWLDLEPGSLAVRPNNLLHHLQFSSNNSSYNSSHLQYLKCWVQPKCSWLWVMVEVHGLTLLRQSQRTLTPYRNRAPTTHMASVQSLLCTSILPHDGIGCHNPWPWLMVPQILWMANLLRWQTKHICLVLTSMPRSLIKRGYHSRSDGNATYPHQQCSTSTMQCSSMNCLIKNQTLQWGNGTILSSIP